MRFCWSQADPAIHTTLQPSYFGQFKNIESDIENFEKLVIYFK